jgi:hypothetical protein
MRRAAWKPKQPQWAFFCGIAAAASLAIYLFAGLVKPPEPGRGIGLWFGIVATVLFAVEAAYPARRKLLAKPLGNARQWIQSHIWLGILAGVFVLVHEGFRKPGGTIGWLLLLLTIWVTVSGLIGVFVQKYYPRALARNLSVEALFERIPELVQRLPQEAEKLIEGGSDVLLGFYRTEVAPALAGIAPSWTYLADVRGGRDERLLAVTRILPFLPDDERPKLEDLKTIYVEKLELDAHYSVQKAMRAWTLLHVPPAALLLGLTIVHVVTFFLY